MAPLKYRLTSLLRWILITSSTCCNCRYEYIKIFQTFCNGNCYSYVDIHLLHSWWWSKLRKYIFLHKKLFLVIEIVCFTIIFNSKIFLQIWHSLTKSLLFVFNLILLKILLAYKKLPQNSFQVSKKVLNLVKVRWIYCTCFYASSHRNFNLIQKEV